MAAVASLRVSGGHEQDAALQSVHLGTQVCRETDPLERAWPGYTSPSIQYQEGMIQAALGWPCVCDTSRHGLAGLVDCLCEGSTVYLPTCCFLSPLASLSVACSYDKQLSIYTV